MQSSQAQLRKASLEEIAAIALEFGNLLMQAGSSTRQIEEVVAQVAHAAGAEYSDVSAGYAIHHTGAR